MNEKEKQAQFDRFFDWRDRMRQRHRTMTMAEYRAWVHVGDVLSHPSVGNAFPGGLTITFGPESGFFGRIDGFEPPPVLVDTI